jgi:transcriptional regulator with XRE-family HTH domain
MSKSVSMADVAKAARVSKNAVSLALRGDPQISESTRRRIEEAAKKLGYRRNPVVGELMARLLYIERQHHRVRSTRNGPRTLDLDILLFNDWRINEPDLVVPHPRAHERAFVLLPLVEIAPDISIPGAGSVKALLPTVSEQSVERHSEQERHLLL